MPKVELILASASPRRKLLLEQIGLSFKVVPSQMHEPPCEDQNPVEYASTLAILKAREISDQYPASLVIGADTIVVIGNTVLGKPEDAESARQMLALLSGRNHQVVTAYSFLLKEAQIEEVNHVLTQVHFKKLSQVEIEHYIASGAPLDKAGGYGIQDYSSIFVDRIEGCFYNVVGLPISDFNENLNKLLTKHSLRLK
ncbi:MAG: Maf family protein [Candidatus Marinimicrobia bacterium]|nr:Maf family protein [Candidatus Neomarinimicrobiota bacterium]MCF7922029.1 Maf family protein [Candidatus Neomarinimicrobiota bacterium]